MERHSTKAVPRIVRTCKNPECGKEFTTRQKLIDKGYGLFCCKACSNTYRKYERDATTRFWERVDTSGDCWLWQGSFFDNGYGAFNVNCQSVRAHRFSYELAHGAIEDATLHVCHSCDNPACVNPSHLFLGTAKRNNEDKVQKDRQAKGERIACSKLTEADVIAIREWFAQGNVSKSEIARHYGVWHSTIERAITGKKWKHVE